MVDAWDALGGGGEGMRELLGSDRLAELAEAPGEGRRLSEVELLAPVPDPEKIIGIGLNYRDHADGGRARAAGQPDLLRQVPQRAGA